MHEKEIERLQAEKEKVERQLSRRIVPLLCDGSKRKAAEKNRRFPSFSKGRKWGVFGALHSFLQKK